MALREEGFWDQYYEGELKNFDDVGDEGEVWFGKGLSRKIAARILDILKSDPPNDKLDDVRILDIGCGNAFLLVVLAQKIMSEADINKCQFLGLDYSNNSIELCRKIVSAKNLEKKIMFKQCDFLDLSRVTETTEGFSYDFVIDVGSYDAICLLASDSYRKLEETKMAYMNSLYSIVKKGTIFMFASCNHTEDELMSLFNLECPSKRDITLAGKIATPTLQFGGKVGSQVCCLIIKFIT